MLKYKKYKKIVFLICCILSFCIACSNTNKSPEVTTSLTTSNGTEIEPIEVEDWMKERAITASNLLEQQDYIKAATLSFLYSPNYKKKVCFYAVIDGEQISKYIDEVISFITQDLENCDMKSSYIIDKDGILLYPKENNTLE